MVHAHAMSHLVAIDEDEANLWHWLHVRFCVFITYSFTPCVARMPKVWEPMSERISKKLKI